MGIKKNPFTTFVKLIVQANIGVVVSGGVGAQVTQSKRDRLCQIPTRGNLILSLILYYLFLGVEAKRSVEFRYPTRNVSRIWRKVGKGMY